MQKKKQGNQDGKAFLLRLMAADLHGQKGSRPAAEKRGQKQGPFGDPPFLPHCPSFVRREQKEGSCIDQNIINNDIPCHPASFPRSGPSGHSHPAPVCFYLTKFDLQLIGRGYGGDQGMVDLPDRHDGKAVRLLRDPVLFQLFFHPGSGLCLDSCGLFRCQPDLSQGQEALVHVSEFDLVTGDIDLFSEGMGNPDLYLVDIFLLIFLIDL